MVTSFVLYIVYTKQTGFKRVTSGNFHAGYVTRFSTFRRTKAPNKNYSQKFHCYCTLEIETLSYPATLKKEILSFQSERS